MACTASDDSAHKKLISQHIYKMPLTYGKDIQVTDVETLSCQNDGQNSRYLVRYRDVACFDVKTQSRNSLKCYKISCESPAIVRANGSVEFDLTPKKECQKMKTSPTRL
jgi:hypothetical protein